MGSNIKIWHMKKLEVRKLKTIFFNSNQTLGKLLDINFHFVYESNKAAILTEAILFGLCWLGNGVTIKKMLLINMLAKCDDKPSAVISMCEVSHGRWWEKRC